MNFRECRIMSMHAIFKEVEKDILPDKTFLVLGGIKNAMYYFKSNNISIIGLSGTGEINCPGIFEDLCIDFLSISPDDFLNEYNLLKNDCIYIIPVISELLGKESVDMDKIGLIGQSYLVIDSIDDKNIYLELNGVKTFLRIDIIKNMEKNQKWIVNSVFSIYKFEKDKLRNNTYLKHILSSSMNELIKKVVNEFTIDNEIVAEDGTIRIEGKGVYDTIINHMIKIKEEIEKNQNTKKYNGLVKYAYLQILHIVKFVVGGTDAYYRCEFREILEKYLPVSDNYNDIINEWKVIESEWRDYGRKLQKIKNYQYICNEPIEGINLIISYFMRIKNLELSAIEKLDNLLI